MKIELKKISFNERLSEETNCFGADLYINGKKVGECKNSGHGGCTDYYGDTPEGKKLIAEAEAYYKSLPKVKNEKYSFTYQPTLENAIDEFLENHLKAKDQKKMEKHMLNSILFGRPNSGSYRMISYKQPLAVLVKLQVNKSFLQKRIMELQVNECKNGVKILNTNLEALGLSI